MCIRNAYHCKECNTTFAIPAQNVTDSLWWKNVMCLLMYVKPVGNRQPVQDSLCNNKYCLRRTESGYLLCLEMRDECWFCIRYGGLGYCSNHLIYVPCETCFYKTWSSGPKSYRYDVPLHYRRQMQ